ncbi:MAG TPA: carboxypeptidase-like regulatory domain-containing protein [Chryseolinea sp.]|nr:carboxypeptidase-like regulatory domain-containing protein [Chryseolinea sp.]
MQFFSLTSALPIMVAALLSSATAQPQLITGRVFDEKSQEPLGFASVSIVGKPVGTVTNAAGEFDFYIPEGYKNDSLVISHVGYKSFRARIDRLAKGSLSVGLKAISVLLREIVIREKDLTGKEIVAKAVKNLTLNYSTKPFCLQGFFRQIEAENGKYVLLTEAAVDLYDKNFDGRPKRDLQESVDVKEMRRSLRYGSQSKRDNIGIPLTDLIENNDVRYNRGMLDSANTFSLDTITVYDDQLVYGVSMSRGTDSGMLYIDMETFGFLKITMERKSRDKSKNYYDERNIKSGKQRRVWFRFSVEFESYNNKLYPRRMHESELNEIYDLAGQLRLSSIETLEFIATNIIPAKENQMAKKLKYGMMIKPTEYNQEFWNHYNVLKLTPLDEKLIQDLEKEISLQEQFDKQK